MRIVISSCGYQNLPFDEQILLMHKYEYLDMQIPNRRIIIITIVVVFRRKGNIQTIINFTQTSQTFCVAEILVKPTRNNLTNK